MNRLIFTLLFLVCFNSIMAADYYVSTSGNDASGNGSQGSPWRTLRFACTKVAANQGHTIRLTAGTFVEQQINVPAGVNVIGAGRDITILKSNPSFYYNPASPGFGMDKMLINISSGSMTAGNQTIKDFTIDGDGKKLHGGMYVKNRSNVTIQAVKIQYTNFTGLWLWDVNDSRVTDVQIKNCSWASSAWCSGALNISNLLRVEIDHVSIDEGVGYGVKALGTTGPMHYLKFHDNSVSVSPNGAWAGGSAPNIAFELWNVDLKGCEFFNNYTDNNISLVMDLPQWANPKGIPTIHIYNNVMDMEKRAGGGGYALEVSVHDIEIDHNYIHRGTYAIVNWDTHGNKMTNWNIHHNTFYGIVNGNPADIVRVQKSGFHNVKFYNNTVEFVGTKTTNLFASYGGTSENVEIKNNLIINSATAYSYYPNKLVYLENSTLSNLQVANNFLVNQAVGTVPGSYSNNITSGDPKIAKSGNRPSPYFVPVSGSPLIDAGLSLGLPFSGGKPDIGAYESGSISTIAVTGVTLTPSTATLSVNGTAQLTETVSPTNATNKNITWTSSNTAVATVNTSGLVTAIAGGTTTITAKTADGNKTATCSVTVTTSTVAVTGVTIAPTTLSLGLNGTAQLAKTIAPSNATNQNVIWSSSNSAVATVSNTGLVTGKASGNATITGTTTDGNKTATASVTVSSAQLLAVDLDNASQGTAINKFNFGSGWTHATNTTDPFFQNTVSFSNAPSNTVTLQFAGNKVELYTAKASHHGIAAVSVDGGPETYVDLYSAARQDHVPVYNSILADGNHTIKIRVTGTKTSASTGTYVVVDYIKVYASGGIAATGVAVSPATVTLGPGSTQQLAATVSPSTATNKNVTWTSSNNSVATVTSSGLITGVAAGTATITAKTVDGDKISASSVSVTTSSVSSVAISPASIAVNLGATHQLNAVVTPSTAANKNVTWRSANNSIATVSPTGVVTAVAVGNVAITATSEDGGKVSTCNFSVNIPVSGVTIDPTTLSLNTGATQAMNAAITPANASNKNVTWTSSNPAVATINNNGTLTALAPGVSTITVTTADGSKKATSSVTVKLQQDFIELDDATIGTSLNQFKYTGSAWTNAANTGDTYFNQTCSHSNTTNHYATLSFTGNKVEFYSSKASHHGIVAVSIDGGPETMVDLYAASRQDYAMVFNSGTLNEGTHNIKIRVTGGRNSSSSASYVVIDYLKVYSSTAVATASTQATESLFNEGPSDETQIYPNPVASGDVLHVRLAEAAGVVSVIDVTGYAHYTAAPTSVDLEIPTSSMPKGMYFVQHKIGGSQVQYKILVD